MPRVHLVASLLKRWLVGTHQGRIQHPHLDYYLDEFTFRFNIVFFGGKDYLPLFSALTTGIYAPKTVFYNSASMPSGRGCKLRRFETSTRTNWHYECANAFIDGRI